MNNSTPLLIEETNLSHAWAKAFSHIINNPGQEISPLLVTLTGFTNGDPEENPIIRAELDSSLVANEEQVVHTVANTIFPISLWKRSKYDRKILFEMYINHFPRYQKLAIRKNRRGIYFERLIRFNPDPNIGNINQLELIISEYKRDPSQRRSLFQASVFDPERDNVPGKYLPFPCLQHISFVPRNTDKTLVLNAFYATQLIFEKAYGNYLGLCRLGAFMAHEMGLTFERMNCFVGVAKLDRIAKSHHSLTTLRNVVEDALNEATPTQTADVTQNGK